MYGKRVTRVIFRKFTAYGEVTNSANSKNGIQETKGFFGAKLSNSPWLVHEKQFLYLAKLKVHLTPIFFFG